MTVEQTEMIPRLLLGRSFVEAGRWEDAERALQDAETEYVLAHDGLRNMNARMQDEIYKRYGRQIGDRVGDAVYDQMTEWCLIGATARPFRAHVQAIAMLWHWHRTPFRMSEDREKITFSLEPCGSGGRLINEGVYESTSRPLTILEEASAATFSQPHFPSWCTHCAFSNRAFLRRGLAHFIIEGWTPQRRGGACVAHAYKRLSFIPPSAAERVGQQVLDEPEVAEQVFSAAELFELARPAVQRIVEAIRDANARAAIDLIDQSWQAWLGLHHAYRCWYPFFYQACASEFGEAACDQLLQESAWELIAPALKEKPDAQTWLRFWRSHGERVTVDHSSPLPVFVIDQAAIVHPALGQLIRMRYAQRLAESITLGAVRNGYEQQFGVLAAVGDTFHHRLPA